MILASVIFCSCSDTSKEADAGAEVYQKTDNSLNLCIYNTDTLNPLKTSARHNAEVLSLLYDSLFSVTQKFEAVPDICESFSVSNDGLVYSFKIRDNIKFQNGKPLTAKDVSKSLNTIISSGGYYKNRLFMVTRTAFSDTHVRIHLDRPVKNFCVLLDFPILYNGGEKDDENDILSKIPSGSGIYSVSEYSVNKKIALTVNKNHHSGHMPYIENININIVPDRKTAVSMLESGQIDLITGDAIDIENYTPAKSLSYKEFNDTKFVFVGMNTDNDVTYSKDVRAYISQVLSETDLSDIFHNRKSHSFVHPDATGNFRSQKADMSEWKDKDGDGILEKENSKKTEKLSFELLVNKENPEKVYLAEKIKQALTSSGINIKIRGYDFKRYTEKIRTFDYELFLGETILLPNFDEDNLKNLFNISKSSEIPVSSLYFKNGVIIYQDVLKIPEIKMLNPYKNIVFFELSLTS